MNTETRNYCIISHTHWDREWYLPFENFRMRLVDLMDNLLCILESDPGYRFHLDAQTIVLEDYLEIRPTRRAQIEGYVREGRLFIGPWYVQNDFHLTSGEATVRNLLIGTEIANRFGACMQVGYAADQFGLCSQLPQILARFGLDSCIFGRGFARKDSQFYWQSEDGSRILCEHMFAWYNNTQRFSADPVGAIALARMRGADCARKGKTHNYLLMNGVDHLEAQEDLTEIIEKVQPLLEADEAFFQDTMPEYIARVKAEIAEKNIALTTHTGEFRDLGAPNVLTGTLASRIYLKQNNARCQAMLEKHLEPLYTMAGALGLCEFPHEYAAYLWKTLIQNHPHDSICGCSVDPVHAHMMDRFRRIEENGTDLIHRGTQLLLSHIDRTGLSDNQYLILNVNPTLSAYNGVMEAVIDIPVSEDIGAFTLTDPRGKPVDFELVQVERSKNIRILSPINLPGGKEVNRYTVRYRANALPGLSYRVLTVTPTAGALSPLPARRTAATTMENEFLKVRVHKNGTVDLTDKKTGVTYRNLLLLEDNADRGDAYRYYENDGSEIVTSAAVRAKIRLIEDTPLVQKLGISYRLTVDREIGRGTVDVEIHLTLKRGEPVLGVEMRLDNRCDRHRLRLHLPTGIETDVNYAGQPFDVITRNKISVYDDDKTHPNTDFVGIDAPDQSHGFAVLQEGLYEYEHMTGANEGTLAITLLRSVRRITGDFANEETMEQGWITPEGVCRGEQQYRLALFPYANDHVKAGVAALSQQFMGMPYTAVQGVDRNKFIGGRPFVQGPGMPDLFYRPLARPEIVLAHSHQLLRITEETTPHAMILSACKGTECMDGAYIIRLYNSTSDAVDCKLRFAAIPKKVEAVTLAEVPTAPLPIPRGVLPLHAAPKQILTLKVTF